MDTAYILVVECKKLEMLLKIYVVLKIKYNKYG